MESKDLPNFTKHRVNDELKKLEFDDSIGGIEFSSDDVINDENVAKAKTLKDLGNKEFLRENYLKSIEYYTNAIILCGLPKTDRAMLYSNRCICYFKLNNLENALKDAKETVKLWPQWWKGYYRLAQIYYANDDYKSLTKAEKCLIQSQSHEQNKEITTLLNKVRLKIGPLEGQVYRNDISFPSDPNDNYYKMTGLEENLDFMKELEKLKTNSKISMLESTEDCRRGHRFRDGTDGLPLDYEKAVECYSKAANSGSAQGMYNLSAMFLYGKGVEQDFELALKYLLKAAQQSPYIDGRYVKIPNLGVAEAEHALGLCYENGLCVKKDFKEAIIWYQKAVDHDSGEAANNLGYIYMDGLGFVERDLDKAEQFFKFALNKGVTRAMVHIIALFLDNSEPEKALDLCKRIRSKGYYFPHLDELETFVKQTINDFEEELNNIPESKNEEENSKRKSQKERFHQKFAETYPRESDIFRKFFEINEKCFNETKSPLNVLNDDKGIYDIQTLRKYANSGKFYAKKLLTAKTHFLDSLRILNSIKDLNNPSYEQLRNFIKQLSLCSRIAFFVAVQNKSMELLVSYALKNKTDFDEDVRICYAALNMGDIDGNIIFLNECLKIYQKTKYFWEMRGNMYAFRGQFDKSIQDFNEALKLDPNDEELLHAKACAMSKLDKTDYHKVIDAYNKFFSIAPEDHRKIPECYYDMALQNLTRYKFSFEKILTEAKKYYVLGQNAEQKQLSFFLPYNSCTKDYVELLLRMGTKDIPVVPQTCGQINKQLTNPYRINIIKKHRENIYVIEKKFRNKDTISTSWKPPNIQKSAKSLAGLNYICLGDMDPTTDKIYDKCVMDLKVIDIVCSDGSSLDLVVEDSKKDVERCYIYNSPLLDDIESANKLYGAGSQFTVVNPHLCIAADTKPAIRIDDINSIVMRDFIKDMCRYCCESNATKRCSRCHTAMYCSRECQVNAYKLNSHKFICCQI